MTMCDLELQIDTCIYGVSHAYAVFFPTLVVYSSWRRATPSAVHAHTHVPRDVAMLEHKTQILPALHIRTEFTVPLGRCT